MYGKKQKQKTIDIIRQKNILWYATHKHPLLGKKRPDVIIRNLKNNPMSNRKTLEKMRLTKLTTSPPAQKGKTYDEYYGIAKANKLKNSASIFMKKNNPTKKLRVRKKISKSNKLFLLKYPERHPNYRLRRNRKTQCEINLQNIIESMNFKEDVDFVFNKYLRTENTCRFPDFRFLKYPLIIEADGYFTHFTKEGKTFDRKRAKEFKKLGFSVLNFSSKEINKKQDFIRESILKYTNQPNKEAIIRI